MIIDLAEDPVVDPPGYDLCVVGSGPAGMTIANELATSGLRICVLESGRLKRVPHADALRAVICEGQPLKDYSRERVFGGTSSTWAGLSSPLDDIDFAQRPFLAAPGWPIGRDELLPYYEQAAARYRFPRLAMFAADGLAEVRAAAERSLAWRDLDEKTFLARAQPQHFGREYRRIFERPGVDLYLDATVLRLCGDDGAERRIAAAAVRTSTGRDLRFHARTFVLATGGIENARLLLKSTDLHPAGLGNEHDQVGRYLMNHPKNYFGVIRLARPVVELPQYFGALFRGFAGYAGLRLREDVQRERQVLNSYVRFEPIFPWSDNRGVEALVLLAKRSSRLLSRWKKRREGKLTALRDYAETGDDSELQNQRRSLAGDLRLVLLIIAHLPRVLQYAWHRLVESARPRIRSVRLRNFIEMEPCRENRVTLADAVDAFGERLPLVRHACTARDRESLIELHRVLAAELAANGFGRLAGDLAAADPWPIDQDASHHLGTARMGDDPITSVVDRHCRVHGVANVHVAGGAVFATSGCANPTYTIVALAIRLAEHLAREVFSVRSLAMPAAEAVAQDAAAAPGGRRVIVIGAGARVLDTALPAFASLGGSLTVVRIYARSERTLECCGRRWPTTSIDRLEEDGVRPGDLVYVAVGKGQVPEVLARLARLPVGEVDLLIDTPVLMFKHLKHLSLFDAFRSVQVAEDCATLPYLELVQRVIASGAIGTLRQVVFLQSGFRYHAFATAKTLFSAAVVRARRAAVGRHTWCDVEFRGGGTLRMLEPRDYRVGRLLLIGSKGSISDYPLDTAGNLLLAPWLEDGVWRGFTLGESSSELLAEERALITDPAAPVGITARMEDLKRIGFRRLVQGMLGGAQPYPLREGLDDMAIDFLLDKLGRYRAWPCVSVKSRFGRRLLRTVTGLSRG